MAMNENHKQERQVLIAIMETLEASGYRVVNAHDSEEWVGREIAQFASQEEILKWATAADMGAIRYLDPRGERFTLHMIYGNSPWEVVADISGENHDAIERGNRLIIPITDKAEMTLR